jgi:hypothetical protein
MDPPFSGQTKSIYIIRPLAREILRKSKRRFSGSFVTLGLLSHNRPNQTLFQYNDAEVEEAQAKSPEASTLWAG